MMKRWLPWALLPYSLWLVFAYDYHFLDGVNLLFHEAGHLLLSPFGMWPHFLGGSLGQLVFPLTAMQHFWRQQQHDAMLLATLWFGESLMNIAHYMADANRQALPLVGGGVHDWAWMFGELGWLNKAERLGTVLHLMAALLVLACTVQLLRRHHARTAA